MKNLAEFITSDADGDLIPIKAFKTDEFNAYLEKAPEAEKNLLNIDGFKAGFGKIYLFKNSKGLVTKVYLGLGDEFSANSFGALVKSLPKGEYEIVSNIPKNQLDNVYLFFLLGAYVFDKYKTKTVEDVKLYFPEDVDIKKVLLTAQSVCMGRDLVNTPTNDMGVATLGEFAINLANDLDAKIEIIQGDELLKQNYPLVHAVGRAGADEPRLIILHKAKVGAPKVAIVGKGVVFDTGGLNLKPGSSMGLMKKDMGGSACALAAFRILCGLGLDIDLKCYVPIVENSVSGNSMRPGDIITSRKGISVEIDNTDAEGRLILADALTRASEDGNELIFDFATLTGAARVALGPDLPPFYTKSQKLANEIKSASDKVIDPLWQMPLWDAYIDDFDTQNADMKNSGGGFAGSITAALFLQKFVDAPEWVHFDVYCWNPKDKPARPMGGEIQAVRSVVEVIKNRFSCG
ncbi:leucyl aminopeptidase family protein [Pseudaquidulcibacter saccharophilus]|uniref:leucyl aminopeptidase family protein n=1 Tax=Pseudaquidulcibacter saccharophilus TaxID=2831900 RepID=UPI001EFF3D9B|nr:leucyl aminopeptidase family protein [Pseudaquidulcibacter saccharophilus]